MGSALSKGAQGAQGAVRRYPSRANIPSTPVPAPRAPLRAKAASTKDQSIVDDGRDPQSFSARLHELGIVTPAPPMTLSPERMKQVRASGGAGTDTRSGQLSAPAVRKVLESRKAHDKKVDVGTVVKAVQLRARGVPDGDIERRLGLQKGTVGKLGPLGVVEWAPPPGAA